MATKVFPKQYTKSEVIPIKNGGTEADNAVQARINLGTKPIQSFTLTDGTAFKLTMENSNSMIFTLKRGVDCSCIVIVDYWDTAQCIGSIPNHIVIDKNPDPSTSGDTQLVIQMNKKDPSNPNNRWGATAVTVIGATVEQVPYDSTRVSKLFVKQLYTNTEIDSKITNINTKIDNNFANVARNSWSTSISFPIKSHAILLVNQYMYLLTNWAGGVSQDTIFSGSGSTPSFTVTRNKDRTMITVSSSTSAILTAYS